MVKYHSDSEETRCRHMGYSYRLTARVLLYAPSHRQDSTYHSLCYTSRGYKYYIDRIIDKEICPKIMGMKFQFHGFANSTEKYCFCQILVHVLYRVHVLCNFKINMNSFVIILTYIPKARWWNIKTVCLIFLFNPNHLLTVEHFNTSYISY